MCASRAAYGEIILQRTSFLVNPRSPRLLLRIRRLFSTNLSLPRKPRCRELTRHRQVQKRDLSLESLPTVLPSCTTLVNWFAYVALAHMIYENLFVGRRHNLVSTTVFGVPASTPQSTVGSDGTFWDTWRYSKNFSAHRLLMSSYIHIEYTLQGHATQFSSTKPQRPRKDDEEMYASKSNVLVSRHEPEVAPLRLCRLASLDSLWS